MAKLFNLARVETSTTGTGSITLGAAKAGFLTFAQAGVQDGDVVTYAISSGTDSEIGRGTYTAAGTVLSRDTILNSTNSDAAISLSGTSEVFITAAAQNFTDVEITSGTINGTPIGASTASAGTFSNLTLSDGGTLTLGRQVPASNEGGHITYQAPDGFTLWITDVLADIFRIYSIGDVDKKLSIFCSGAGNINGSIDGNWSVGGALSKASGSFRIDHPLPELSDTTWLYHSFVEGPTADNIYRGSVELDDGAAEVNIDAHYGMTNGTFSALNGNVQLWLQNETGWARVRGSVSGSILSILCENTSSDDTISWLVISERQDKHILETSWTDEFGRPILERLKDKNDDTATST